MKNKFLLLLGGSILGAYLLSPQNIAAQTNGSAPTILVQPLDQATGYGSNITLTVTANGVESSFQWKKNGEDLKDYGKVFGAQSSTLKILGVGQEDVGNYSVVIRSKGGANTSAVATVTMSGIFVFREDFESGNLKNWIPLSTKGKLSISSQKDDTAHGMQSAKLTNSAQKMYHNLGTELAGRAIATFYMYDDGSEQSRLLGEIRGYTGPGHATYARGGGMNQMFAIGCFYSKFGTNNTGSIASAVADPKKYQGRVLRGTNAGWFNLDAPGSPDRSTGWHKFEIERLDDGTTILFKVDGILGKTITKADPVFLDCVTIGSVGTGDSVCSGWFDDVKVEAFPRKYDWQAKDSEGKGLFDWMKLREVGNDPTVSDITQISTVSEALGKVLSGSRGQWQAETTGVSAKGMRGYVEYILNAPADDAYRIEIEGREKDFKIPLVELSLNVSIDGENIGRFTLPYGEKTNGFVHCFTPFIKAGPHTIRIYWDNAESYCSLYLEAVRLQKLVGADLNNNGIKDWVENRMLNQSGIEVAPTNSITSPVCVEGRDQHLGMMSFLSGSEKSLSPITVHRGIGEHWYAEVPLSAGAETEVQVSYQDGQLTETRGIVWEVTDLLRAKDVTIRKGDSLLLNAVAPGQTSGVVNLSIAKVANYTTDAATPVAHRFDQAGIFDVSGEFVPTGSRGSIKVKVVEASLDSSIATWVNKQRYWSCTNFPPEVVIEADPGIKLQRYPAPLSVGTNMSQYAMVNDSTKERVLLARLGNKGPILANTPVKGFRLSNAGDTYLRHIKINKDGSQLIEGAYVLSPVLPEVTIGVRVLVSGVTFEDGTVTKSLTASDFDEFGICRVRFIRAAGVTTSICHATKAYQGDVVIGWPTTPK